MSELYSSDNAMSGVWRAYVVKPLSDGSAHIFIPTLHRGLMPFEDISSPSSGIVEGCETSYPIANDCCWKVRTPLKAGDVVWVTFENANSRHPIILGNFGSMVDIVQPGMGNTGSTYVGDGTTGNANADKIFKLLISECGLSIAAACGVLGNVYVESGGKFDPGQEVPDGSSTSMGIFMFYQSGHGGKNFSNLKAHCGSYGYNTIEGQIEYARQWLNNEFSGYGNGAECKRKLNAVADSADGAAQAAAIWCDDFENPGIPHLETRQTKAKEYYEIFKAGKIVNGTYEGPSLSEDAIDLSNIDQTNLTEKQKKVLKFGASYKGDATSGQSGYCQAWVADVYAKALGVSRASRGHASEAGRDWGKYRIKGFPDYTDRNKLNFSSKDLPECSLSQVPIGACVYALYSASSGYSGHVAIYIGGGEWLGNHGSPVPSVKTIQQFADKGYKGFVWGWNGDESLL